MDDQHIEKFLQVIAPSLSEVQMMKNGMSKSHRDSIIFGRHITI
jgi:hypothetical protein